MPARPRRAVALRFGMSADPTLVFAWLTARSLARGLPAPIPDRGGFRVDTGSDTEVRRWIFPHRSEALAALVRELTLPRHFVKLCGSADELASVLLPGWALSPLSYFMTAGVNLAKTKPLPKGYSVAVESGGSVTRVCIHAPDGALAASGYAAETAEAFVYDRIETAPEHRRRGLGSAVFRALGGVRKAAEVPELLTATEAGLGLYTRFGWTVLSPYASAVIASPQ